MAQHVVSRAVETIPFGIGFHCPAQDNAVAIGAAHGFNIDVEILYGVIDAVSGEGAHGIGARQQIVIIGFLHDGITQIIDNGYDNVQLVIPSSGTSFEIGATAIFKGAKHPNAAKLWIEYALSPDCVNIAKDNGSYQFLVIDNAEQPSQAAEFGLDPDNVMDYDFEDAKNNIKTYIEEVMNAIADSGADTGADRFKTE